MVDLNEARAAVDLETQGKKSAQVRRKYTFFSLLSR
jgi:hypothetical protein